jgi:hypothetical protein
MSNPDEPSISDLEILGIVSSRLVHSLANSLSIISGNLYVARASNQPGQTGMELEAAVRAGNGASAILSRFVDFRRAAGENYGSCTLRELIACLQRRGWFFGPLLAEIRTIPVSLRWVNFVFDSLAFPAASVRARIVLDASRLRLAFEWTGMGPIDWSRIKREFGPVHLVAAYELVQQVGGRWEERPSNGGTHETALVLPCPDE